MALKLIEKSSWNQGLPEMTISISKSGFVCFSKDLAKKFKFEKYWGMEVYIDEGKKLVGFKGSNNRQMAYAFSHSRRNNLRCLKLKNIGQGGFSAKEDNGMILIKYGK